MFIEHNVTQLKVNTDIYYFKIKKWQRDGINIQKNYMEEKTRIINTLQTKTIKAITREEFGFTLKSLSDKKATGVDGIPYEYR